MSKANAARRLATAAAYGGGGLGLFGGSLYGLLRAEAALARRTIGNAKHSPPNPSGLYGAGLTGPPIRLVVLGDSGAAGYGAERSSETFGAFLAAGLADMASRRVRLTSLAKVGTKSAQLMDQIALLSGVRFDVAVIIVGTNDVTHRIRPASSVRALQDAVQTLVGMGGEVVVGTCPDLGTVRPIAQPLRQVARSWSRRLAAAQTIATVEAGGRSVSLGSILGPEFDAAPHELFGPDRFHPSPAGYRSCAAAMLPTVAAAVGVGEAPDAEPEAARGEGVYTLATAAAAAADSTGTEVARSDMLGGDHGARGRWVLLRHRRRLPMPDVNELSPDEATGQVAGEEAGAALESSDQGLSLSES